MISWWFCFFHSSTATNRKLLEWISSYCRGTPDAPWKAIKRIFILSSLYILKNMTSWSFDSALFSTCTVREMSKLLSGENDWFSWLNMESNMKRYRTICFVFFEKRSPWPYDYHFIFKICTLHFGKWWGSILWTKNPVIRSSKIYY